MLLEIVDGPSAFKIRAGAVILRDGHVLLHLSPRSGVWMTPGGTGEHGETSRATLFRELREELGVDAAVGRLLWIVEHFFELSGRRWHQTLWLHETTLPEGCDAVRRDAWEAEQPEGVVLFRWVPLAELPGLPVIPGFLATSLRDLPREPRHLVHSDAAAR